MEFYSCHYLIAIYNIIDFYLQYVPQFYLEKFMNSKKYQDQKSNINHWIRIRNPHLLKKNSPKVKSQYSQSQIKIQYQNQILTYDRILPEWLTNHQVYQKLFPNFINIILKGKNLTYIFCGQPQERLNTFLGNPSDPGILLIVMIYILQQKYKHEHGQINVKIQFLEYCDGQFFDLLNTSTVNLKFLQKKDKYLQGTTSISIQQYIQFLRILKISLYNNKKRDFKVNKSQNKTEKDSIFMARIIVNSNIKGVKKCSSILLVDLSNQQKKKYFIKDQLIEISSIKNEKKSFKLQVNEFKQYLTEHVKNSLNTQLIYCMSLLQQTIGINIQKLQAIKLIEGISIKGQRQCKNTYKKYDWAVIAPQDSNLQFADYIVGRINKIMVIVKELEYKSINDLTNTKQQIKKKLQTIKIQIQNTCQNISNIIQTKIKLSMENKVNFMELKQLIGNCIKSQNISQFYTSKTYNSLYREVAIRTQQSTHKINIHLQRLDKLNAELLQTIKSSMKVLKQLEVGGNILNQKISKQICVMYKQILGYLNQQQKKLHYYQEDDKIWLQKIQDKIRFQQFIIQIKTIFNSFINQLFDPKLEYSCHFKQLQFISKNNQIFRTHQILKSLSTQKNIEQSVNHLPQLLFKKVPLIINKNSQCQSVNNLNRQKHRIRLSDFLLRVKTRDQDLNNDEIS